MILKKSSGRIFASILAVTISVLSLTACSVTSEERESCEARGAKISNEKYVYSSGLFGDKKTGSLTVCVNEWGTILNVYNDRITEVDTGFLGTSNDNQKIFKECSDRNGVTYKTRERKGKTHHTRFVCIIDGAYKRILD